MAEEARVVVFSVEFRFGPLGYLTHPALDAYANSGRSGNYGMLDQLLGLRWVRENARAFGGEAEQVTVFGQSSGSTDIALLLAAPRARGLFHRAILDSVPVGAAVGSRARALDVGQKAAQAAGCNGPEAAGCLRTVSTEQLLKSAANAGLVFAPHVDGALFPVAPLEAFATGAYAHMPILLGTARDEQAYFRPDVPDVERYAAMMREEFPKVAAPALALYPVGKYGTPKSAFIAAMSDADFTCPSGTPKWEPYEPSRDPVMLLDLHPALARDLRPDECNFWDRSGS